LYEIASNMIQNFLDLIEIYGFVPTNDTLLLRKAFPLLLKEYKFWRKNTTIRVNKNNKQYVLNHYNVYNIHPRPESFLEDYITVEQDSFNLTKKKELYSDITTAAESGWDFSTRWTRNPYIPPPKNSSNNYEMLRTLNTRSVIPVELNSILYMNEITLSEFAKLIDDSKVIGNTVEWLKNSANERLEGMIELLWDDNTAMFRDYNVTSDAKSNVISLASYYPFWAKALSKDVLTDSKKILKSFSFVSKLLSKYEGSPPVTLINSSLQWDFPNAWPPLTYVIVKGLLDSYNSHNDPELLKIALETSQHYVSSVLCAWYSTGGSLPGLVTKLPNTTDNGIIFEKYSALKAGVSGTGGEYQVQIGFGWTNGILLWICSKLGDKLEVPKCING
ncbi:15925_t:CDS:2, partial [Gigaspora rosea]